jgi:hypothetical protein
MTVNRTTLLNLSLPVTGTESGLWGDYTNNGLTEYLDTSIAGALSITATTTLANTTGTNSSTGITTTTAQYRTLVVPAAGVSANVVITAPSSNRTYHVVNRNATYTVQIRAGANSGVTLGTNQSATVTYNTVTGDYELVGTIGPTVPVARGGTGATTLTANNVILGNGTSAVQFVAPGTNGNVLTSNGTTWTSAAAGASLSGQTDSATPFETALGYQAGNANTGVNNTFIGYQAGLLNSTGTDNVAIGYAALDANTTGNRNVAIGVDAFGANVSGAQNVHIGYQANFTATSGNGQTMVGYQPGLNTTGNNNTFIGYQTGISVTTGTNNLILGYSADASSATVSNEVTIGNTSITSTRLRGMVQLNAAMFEQATVSATAATGTINFDARTQSVLYYTSNASANWTLNVRGASGVSLDSVMSTGQSLTIAFLVTNGGTAYYQSAFQVDGSSVTPKWQGGTAPTSGNASSVDIYAITLVKTGSATFTAFASQTKFA